MMYLRQIGRFVWGIVVAITYVHAAFAQSPEPLSQLAAQAYSRKEYVKSLELYSQALLHPLPGTHHDCFVGKAKSLARLERKDAAIATLQDLAASGFTKHKIIETESAFELLRSDSRWVSIVEDVKRNHIVHVHTVSGPASDVPFKERLTLEERISGLTTLWSEVKRSFANFDICSEVDWNERYTWYLAQVIKTEDTYSYYRLLKRMCAELRDGHTAVHSPARIRDHFEARPAIECRLVDGQVIVTRVGTSARAAGISEYQEIVSIDELPAIEYANKQVIPYVSASTEQDRTIKVYGDELFAGSIDKKVRLLVKTSGEAPKLVEVDRVTAATRLKELPAIPQLSFRMLEGNLAYVAVNSFSDYTAATEFRKNFQAISTASGLILDLRDNRGGNSLVGAQILSCLIDKKFQLGAWRTREYLPSYRVFGFPEVFVTAPERYFEPDSTRYFGKPVVLLVGPATYSAAETFAVAFDDHARGKLIGEPTAGSAGNPLFFRLVGGGIAQVSTSKESYSDGEKFVGIGVKPSIAVRNSVSNLRSGKDAVLQAGIVELTKRVANGGTGSTPKSGEVTRIEGQ